MIVCFLFLLFLSCVRSFLFWLWTVACLVSSRLPQIALAEAKIPGAAFTASQHGPLNQFGLPASHPIIIPELKALDTPLIPLRYAPLFRFRTLFCGPPVCSSFSFRCRGRMNVRRPVSCVVLVYACVYLYLYSYR